MAVSKYEQAFTALGADHAFPRRIGYESWRTNGSFAQAPPLITTRSDYSTCAALSFR